MEDSQPRVVYLLGRSGHGKSSLVNAILNNSVANIGHVEPTTPSAHEYTYRTMDGTPPWTLVDSRGIFETTRPSGANCMPAVKQIELDVQKYNPNVILYVVSCSEVRNLSNDLQFLHIILSYWNSCPVVVVLSKADCVGDPRQWPPETYPTKSTLLNELMTYMAENVLYSTLGDSLKIRGGMFGYELVSCDHFCYIVPLATLHIKPQIMWNIDTLKTTILLGCYRQLENVQRQKRCRIT